MHSPKPVSDCINNFPLDLDHAFVDLDRVVNDCLAIVHEQVALAELFIRNIGKLFTLARVI